MTQQPSRPDSARGPTMQIHQVLTGPPHEGEAGQGLVFRTSRGDVPAILHQAEDSQLAAIYVCGAGGGFGGPAGGVYARLGESLLEKGITGMRLNYRQPNVFPECVLDLLAGVMFLQKKGYGPVALVGHSFGGAVVVAAGAASRHVCGVAALASQTYGANMASLLLPSGCWSSTGRTTPGCPSAAGCRFTIGPGSRSSWCFTTGRNTACRSAGRNWKHCWSSGFRTP